MGACLLNVLLHKMKSADGFVVRNSTPQGKESVCCNDMYRRSLALHISKREGDVHGEDDLRRERRT